jgi:SAM-dependent methyltransferase
MKIERTLLNSILICERCGGDFSQTATPLTCKKCNHVVREENGKLFFSDVPSDIQPFDPRERGPDIGTPWRRANWKFLQQQVAQLRSESIILDVGAGRGDFVTLFEQRSYLALDIYPYPQVDVVCDLTKMIPFHPRSIDAIILMNVLEHVYNSHELFAAFAQILAPGGKLIVAIPFLLKLHQTPYDFVRYTHYALQKLGEDHHLALSHLEGYYDPAFIIGEGINHLKFHVVPAIPKPKHYVLRAILWGLEFQKKLLQLSLGKGQAISPDHTSNPAPVGYQAVYTRPLPSGSS